MKTREYDPSTDLHFVTSYWVNYYRKNSSLGRSVPARIFLKEHRRLIDKALKRCLTFMLVDPHDPDHLVGFINFYRASEFNVLNFIFIKKSFRKHGLGMDLFKLMESFADFDKGEELVITHEGNLRGLTEKYKLITYNPYLFSME